MQVILLALYALLFLGVYSLIGLILVRILMVSPVFSHGTARERCLFSNQHLQSGQLHVDHHQGFSTCTFKVQGHLKELLRTCSVKTPPGWGAIYSPEPVQEWPPSVFAHY